jgi:broad specificity phosphatase PhoE
MAGTRLTFVRHAASTGGPGDPGLSPGGREQAGRLALTVDPHTALVVTSPLQRAKATAEIVASALGSGVEIDARLRERINWGDVEGQTFNEFSREWQRTTQDLDYVPPMGRSVVDVGLNIVQFCNEIADRFEGENAMAVTHGGVIAALLHSILDGDLRAEALSRCDTMPFCSPTLIETSTDLIEVVTVAGSPL